LRIRLIVIWINPLRLGQASLIGIVDVSEETLKMIGLVFEKFDFFDPLLVLCDFPLLDLLLYDLLLFE
jgi:hypothetical protein